MIPSWKTQSVAVLLLSVFVAGCATCGKDMTYTVNSVAEEEQPGFLTAADNCVKKYFW